MLKPRIVKEKCYIYASPKLKSFLDYLPKGLDSESKRSLHRVKSELTVVAWHLTFLGETMAQGQGAIELKHSQAY